MAPHVKKNTPILVTKSCNLNSFNLIFIKKYTDHLTIIKHNHIKFQGIRISCSPVTVLPVYDGKDRHQDICIP